MTPVARLDYLTLHSVIEPRDGSLWRGSSTCGYFIHQIHHTLRVFGKASFDGLWRLQIPGAVFRHHFDWHDIAKDLFGDPLPPLRATRIDLAIEHPCARVADVDAAARWLLTRTATTIPKRYGWRIRTNDSSSSRVRYIEACSRPDLMPTADLRSKPYFWRVYQRTDGPLRLELERKQLEASLRTPDDAIDHVGREFTAVTGYDVEHWDGVIQSPEWDRRADPAKLFRQAEGLYRAALLRKTGERQSPEVDRLFRALRHLLDGRP